MRETLQDQDRLIITHINYTPQRAISLLSTAKSLAKLSSSVLSAPVGIRLSLIIITILLPSTVRSFQMTISGKLCITLISLMRNMKWKKMF